MAAWVGGTDGCSADGPLVGWQQQQQQRANAASNRNNNNNSSSSSSSNNDNNNGDENRSSDCFSEIRPMLNEWSTRLAIERTMNEESWGSVPDLAVSCSSEDALRLAIDAHLRAGGELVVV